MAKLLILAAVAVLWVGGTACKAPPAKRCELEKPEPININQPEAEMLLPKSVKSVPAPPLVIQVSDRSILVNNKAVAQVKGGKVDANTKRDGPDGFFIDPLFKRLKTEAQRLKTLESQGGRPFMGDLTLIVHKGTPYRLLAEVLYTSNQAEFKTYTFGTGKMSR